MSLENEAHRGRLAEDVLKNPVYAEAYALIEQGITAKWRTSQDPAEREELHRTLKLLDKVKGLLESTMDSGKVAQNELGRKQSLAERTIGRLRSSG